MAILEFGEYLPDLPDFNNPGVTEAKNVIPGVGSYLQFPGQVVYSNALGARCQGAVSGKDNSGNSANFAGDATKLYKLASAAYSDVSVVGGYTTNSEENWHFTQYGDLLVATNNTNQPQGYFLSTSSAFFELTAELRGRYCASVRNFLVFGNVTDLIDGSVPNRVRWSALNDPTDFTVSPVTQSDYNDLDGSKGWIKQIVGGEYGVIFQERAITRMVYVGSPAVFQFDEVESGRGTQFPYSVVKVGNNIFYLGYDGFYIFDGNQSIPIGEGKVNRTFFDEVDLTYKERVCATADINKQVIYVAYPADGNSGGNPNKILMYNYAPEAKTRWSYCDGLNLEFINISISEGTTLEQLDAISASLDALTVSLDSRTWTGETYILSGFDSSHKQVNFTGDALTALLETTEAQLTPSGRTNLLRVRPVVDGSGTVAMQLGTRNLLSESVTWGSALSVDQVGDVQTRSNARFHRARVNISGGFNHAQGIDVIEYKPAGRR